MSSSKYKKIVPYRTVFALYFDLEELSVLDMVFRSRSQDDFSRAIIRKVSRILDNYDYPEHNG